MAPNAIDLTWLKVVKQRAEVVSNNEDSDIQAAITGLSQWLLNSGTVSFNSIVTMDETYSGNGNNRLFLRQGPIKSLIEISVVGGFVFPVSDGSSWGVYIEDSKKSIALRGGSGLYPRGYSQSPYRSSLRSGPSFPLGTGNIRAKYTGGYEPRTVDAEVNTVTSQAVTVQVAPWIADGGVVFYPSLAPLVKVANSPNASQYAVTATGTYVFSEDDDGSQVAITYNVNAAPFDLEYAVRCCCAINYKRKAWQDVKSKGVSTGTAGSSTTTYRDWDFPPEHRAVFDFYTRNSYQFG